MNYAKGSVLILTLLLASCASDPNAPRYQKQLLPIAGRTNLMPVETVRAFCKSSAKEAGDLAEERFFG